MNDTWPEKVAELPDDEATQPAEDEAAAPVDDEAAAPVDDEAAQPVEDETAAPPLEPLIRTPDEHTAGGLDVPDGYAVLEGSPDGAHRGVAVVVARFNGEISSSLLASALDELERAGVLREAITVVPVPGAFELPLAAMAFAKTRRYACVVALGCVIRGETPHFDFVAGEAASGLQLAALETGVPVAFGVLTTETVEQAEKRTDKGAEAARCALEMADLFAQLRIAAASV